MGSRGTPGAWPATRPRPLNLDSARACTGAVRCGKAGRGRPGPDYRRPVWPNPPAPRFVSVNSSTSSKRTRATGTTTSWAIRSPGSMT